MFNRTATSQHANYDLVFKDCSFRGKSSALTLGKYNNLRDLNIRNDAILSMKVPDGMPLILFEHEWLRGKSTLIDSDIRCLNQNWNEEASSLEVISNLRFGITRIRTDQNRYAKNGAYSSERSGEKNEGRRYGKRGNSRNDENRGSIDRS